MPSLKQFHIFFVFISVVLSLFMMYWSYNQSLYGYFGLSFLLMFVLIFYGNNFYRKLSDL